MTAEETCPSHREWLDWATDRWLDLDPESLQAEELLREIFRENGRLLLRRNPRRLTRRAVLRRRDPEALRTMIWLRNRKMLRARGVGLRSVPPGRQAVWPFASEQVAEHAVVTRKDSYGEDLRTWAARVLAKDVFWMRTQCDLHAVAHWLSPEALAALQKPLGTQQLPDCVNHVWREAVAALEQAKP